MADNIITKDGHIKFSIPKVDTNFNKNNDYSFNNYTITETKDKNINSNNYIEPETIDLESPYTIEENQNVNNESLSKEEYLKQLDQIENTLEAYKKLNIEEISDKYFKAKEELDSIPTTDPNYYTEYLKFSEIEEEYNTFLENNATLIGVYRELKEYEKILPYLRKKANDNYNEIVNNYNNNEYDDLINLDLLFSETNKYNSLIDENNVYKDLSSYWENYNIEELKSKGYLDENSKFTGDYLTLIEGIMNKSNLDADKTINKLNYYYQNNELEKYIDAYQFLNDEEKELYHYLFKTEGSSVADDYLSKMQDKINQAKGYKEAENLINRLSTDYDLRSEYLKATEEYQKLKEELQTTPTMDAGYQALLSRFNEKEKEYNIFMEEHPEFKDVESISAYDYLCDNLHVTIEGLGDGLNQFNQGFSRVFISDGEISAADYKTMYLSQYLDQDKILSINYKASTSTGNMLPAIAISMMCQGLTTPFVGQITGNSIRTISMFGNSQNEALLNGYNSEQARSYALLNSAAESLSEYFIGGIPGLSTKTAAGEVQTLTDRAINILINSTNEGIQETIQTYIEAGIKSAILGEKFNITATSEEALEAGLIGFITSWNLQGPNMADLVINGKEYSINVNNAINTINSNPDAKIMDVIENLNNNESNIQNSSDIDDTAKFKFNFLNKNSENENVHQQIPLTPQQQAWVNTVNNIIKHGTFEGELKNTSRITSDMLAKIDDLSKVSFRMDLALSDINGNYMDKYQKPKYIRRVTYNGAETYSILQTMENIQSKVDMNLPITKRARQIYDIISSEIPVMWDYDKSDNHALVSQSLRGITSNNIVGKKGLVCAGFSSLYREICTRCGIKCDYIRGIGIIDPLTGKSGRHAWNVFIDENGKAVPVDVTWKASMNEEWFGGGKKFQESHIADADETFKNYGVETISPRQNYVGQVLDSIVLTMNQYYDGAGLDALRQYVNTGDDHYITRKNDGRNLIKTISYQEIIDYLRIME